MLDTLRVGKVLTPLNMRTTVFLVAPLYVRRRGLCHATAVQYSAYRAVNMENSGCGDAALITRFSKCYISAFTLLSRPTHSLLSFSLHVQTPFPVEMPSIAAEAVDIERVDECLQHACDNFDMLAKGQLW